MNNPVESTFWKGSSSQWLNLWHYLAALALAAGISAGGIFFPPAFAGLVIPLAWIMTRYLIIRCNVYELTTERLRITTGILNQHIDEVELYRVKDILVERRWWMRLTGLGTIHIETSDRTLPNIDIRAVRDAIGLREALRKKVEHMREQKRVRELDFEDSASEPTEHAAG
ncbi:MAG: hypothetical protein RL346_2190 [Verrucomicrobiota bacterium]|jgi:uncharacterized membrane protein YdbT with pleckstrin-like domain